MLRRFGLSRLSLAQNSSSLYPTLRWVLSETEYHKIADQSLDALVDDLEAYFEALPSAEVDIQYSQGVLTLQLGSKGTFVINKQSPNKQIWLSSPISGPFRYDYENGDWIYHRDLHQMKTKLREELTQLFKKQPKLH